MTPTVMDNEAPASTTHVTALLSATKTVARLQLAVRRPLARQKLNLATFHLLAALVDAPKHTIRATAIAEQIGLTTGGVSKLLNGACNQGYVRREPNPSDGRGVLVVLTPYGQERLYAATPDLEAAIRAHLEEAKG